MRRGVAAAAALLAAMPAAAAPFRLGSKKFTESYVLSEIARISMARSGLAVEHRQGMGGTIILWEALVAGAISAYPEYTGTVAEEILRIPSGAPLEGPLARLGIGMTAPLGFDDTYALVMRRDRAAELGVTKISDLRSHPGLAFGLTHEFLGRRDGWEPLAAIYGLAGVDVRGLDHTLGYAALAERKIDVKDAYSTDARILEDDLVPLADDRKFFPDYRAVFLYRLDSEPRGIAALRSLAGTIPASEMIRLNFDAEKTKDYTHAAELHFGRTGNASGALGQKILGWTIRHLELVAAALAAAVAIGIPLGIWASRSALASAAILGFASVVQTIPALALLALLVPVPFLGIGPATAIVALFLYALLPIVRNTATGLSGIPRSLSESAEALGLSPGARLGRVFLPLAMPSILAGIQTSAVISVGGATLAALIGAGGLGEPIVSGLNLNDHALILEGALPAAALALVVQTLFRLLERWLVPRGLRPRAAIE